MSDQMTDQPQFQTSVDVKLDYIQKDIGKIERSIDQIKNDVISRREFTDSLASMRKEFSDANLQIKTEFLDAVKGVKKDLELPKKILYGIMSAAGLAVLYALLNLVIAK